MLKELLAKTELDYEKDTNRTAFLKGCAEGALEGLVVLGAVHTAIGLIKKIKK